MSIIVGAVVVWIGVQSSALGHFLWWLLRDTQTHKFDVYLCLVIGFHFLRPRREKQKNWRISMQQIVCLLRPRREKKKKKKTYTRREHLTQIFHRIFTSACPFWASTEKWKHYQAKVQVIFFLFSRLGRKRQTIYCIGIRQFFFFFHFLDVKTKNICCIEVYFNFLRLRVP